MHIFDPFARRSALILAASMALAPSVPASAAGDLLIAPTRVILNGGGSAEVVLSNVGNAPATYRIALELRRMDADGDLIDVAEAEADAGQKSALAMVRHAPRRITLEPNQPQAVRITARPGAELPDGEYRVHMSFKAIPDAAPATMPGVEARTPEGLTVRLVPIYGLTMPVIVRKGQLQAAATINAATVEKNGAQSILTLDIARTGNRSLYGEILAQPRGQQPVSISRGVGIYPEVARRTFSTPLSPDHAARLRGPVRIEYREPSEQGGKVIAAIDTVLP